MWACSKEQVYQKQNGQCGVCGEFLTGRWILHHICNRFQGGTSNLENCEGRHPNCEAYMHSHYLFGNFDGDRRCRYVPKRRGNRSKRRKKH